MTGYSDFTLWTIIIALGVGTFAIRFSFLGLLGDKSLPPALLRVLRYTPVAVIPALMAPQVVWPVATSGQTDATRLAAAAATVFVGWATKNVLAAISAGGLVLATGLWLGA